MQVLTKNFEGDTLTVLEATVNAFLATVDRKDVLDVYIRLQRAGRYGLQNAYFATILYIGTPLP